MRIYIIGQAVGLVTLYFFIFFIAGTIKKNNSIVDIGWGLGFVITAWFTLFISRSFFREGDDRLVSGCVPVRGGPLP